MLALLGKHQVRYLIVGGLAFIYHAKPRYTKDMDIWLDPDPRNIERTNRALAEFGSPGLLDPHNADEILQIGVAPNRIDLLRDAGSLEFHEAWPRRIKGHYGDASAWWIDLDSLLAIKSRIDHPRHREDARILSLIRERKKNRD
jgi:hypothetical protein